MLKAARPAGKRSLPSYRVKREQFRNGPEVTVWDAILDYILIWKNIIFQTFHVRTSVSIWPTGLDQLLLRCRKITRNWVNLSISQQWSRKSLFDWHRSERTARPGSSYLPRVVTLGTVQGGSVKTQIIRYGIWNITCTYLQTSILTINVKRKK